MWSDIYQTSYTELAYAYDTHASCQGRALVKVWGPKDEGTTPTTSEKTLAHRGYKADITEGEGSGGATPFMELLGATLLPMDVEARGLVNFSRAQGSLCHSPDLCSWAQGLLAHSIAHWKAEDTVL